ncbi:TM7SF3 isoform 6 [Pan troglodytes]|uniref:Transmembrane 7 superfamily member 3 n=2 Tax=Homininae TaxID=207598 RepID=F5GY35_HUMAN|nr:transmembrane 7 superfamily member 3 [Homo sapiens]KAI4065163.1 transmembrane 7 superfamily member 3 [Homo sapiens]PNI98668.1 TM7SF3 isoform 6 [Pan troglodytes]
MGFLQLLVVAVLASEHRVAGAAEVFGNSSEDSPFQFLGNRHCQWTGFHP